MSRDLVGHGGRRPDLRWPDGAAPRGFFRRGPERPSTRSLLAERGCACTLNGFVDDLPCRDRTGLALVPYARDANDVKFLHPDGFVCAAEMVEDVADALDVLEAEAARGLPRPLDVGFHLRIVGRRRDRLWIARRIDIAEALARRSP